MKHKLLEYLTCPLCSARFICQPSETEGDEVRSGVLVCTGCGKEYPIVRYIPRILPSYIEVDKKDTADTFGWEWLEFDTLHRSEETYRDQFLDWVWPIEPKFFANKVVLDAGCGMGRFSAAAATFGAKDVIAVDLSDAVESAYAFTRDMPNVHVVQCDIYALPLAPAIDFAFSIGVLHHLPDPKCGFLNIARYLSPKGSIFAWVYGRENNGWIVYIANPIRERLLSRMPHRALYWVSFMTTVALHPLLKLFYLPVRRLKGLSSLKKVLPYFEYLSWLSQFGFRHNHHVVFDHMAAPTAFYIRREEFEGWFKEGGLKAVSLSWRNENSWRGWGRKVASETEEEIKSPSTLQASSGQSISANSTT